MDRIETNQRENRLDHHAWWMCALLTLAPAIFAASQYNQLADLLPAMAILPAWMVSAAILGFIGAFIAMVRRREPSPIGAIVQLVRENWQAIIQAAILILLAGLNMIAFMWVKPLLNQLVPFWADPMLADLDKLLFLGSDPWTLMSWANIPLAGAIYHPGWFFTIAIALLVISIEPPSPRKSAVVVTYFAAWTLIGPLVHTLLPAAGPIFYEAMGYGSRFADMQQNPETLAVRDYLWNFYASGSFGAGNGISAMPSMHVTTSSWVVIAAFALRRNWVPAALIAWVVIFVLSIALGWHYALDGIVGAIAAFATYRALLAFFSAKRAHIEVAPSPRPELA